MGVVFKVKKILWLKVNCIQIVEVGVYEFV